MSIEFTFDFDFHEVPASEITDTAGALFLLKQRSGKDYSPDTLHYHVREGNLAAYVFVDAELLRWTPGRRRSGQALIFLKRDIEAMPVEPQKRGRKLTHVKPDREKPIPRSAGKSSER